MAFWNVESYPNYPAGFFRLESANGESQGWGHYCPKCKHVTLGDENVRAGLELKAFHCGAWKTLVVGRVKKFLLPVLRMPWRRGQQLTNSIPVGM